MTDGGVGELRRGDVVIISAPGDYGKPRPAVIVQADALNAQHPSFIVCPFTSTLVDAPLLRIQMRLSPGNGLQKVSQIMADKLLTLRREKVEGPIGCLEEAVMRRLDAALARVLGLQFGE